MEGTLKKNTQLKSINGITYTIVKKLGEGGQGQVYEVHNGSSRMALKWYFKHTATKEQREIIENLIKRGSPSFNFLWPVDLIFKEETFGYIMPLRPDNYKSIVDMMKRKAEPSFEALCIAGINLVTSYGQLHSMGYSYRDISFGNVFIDPENGNVLICDNDNVSINGLNDGGVCGTQRFMAPEIVRGEKKPSTDTDLFSMSVLLFYMFMLHHPLEGALEASIKCMDINAMNKIYGTNPIFIWDPDNDKNRPVWGYQDNALIYWKIYPEFIKTLFTRAFTEGIKNPKGRIVEKEWKDAFVHLLNSIVLCPKCGAEIFYDEDLEKAGGNHRCWNCHSIAQIPSVLNLGREFIILNKTTKLYEHHIKENYNFKRVIGCVVQNPKDLSKWGIKNLSKEVWMYHKPDGSKSPVGEGRTAPMIKGASINFGNIIGQY